MNSRPTDSTPEGQIKDLDLVQKRYDHEWDRARDLDGKAGHLLGYVTIITGLILGLGAFSIVERLYTLSHILQESRHCYFQLFYLYIQ